MPGQNSNQVMTASNWNVPNALTVTRILLAVVLFGALECHQYCVALILFVFAAGTDWVDGWWARKYNQCTVLGRIMDPLADKLIVCGTLIYLASIPELLAVPFGLAVWMVVVVITRELLITTLRAYLEQQGRDFSAKWIGKWKMGLQCVAIPACLLWLMMIETKPGWLYGVMVLTLWGTVAVTIYSGVIYVVAAIKMK